jgi:arylsulfatase A-like enzyme
MRSGLALVLAAVLAAGCGEAERPVAAAAAAAPPPNIVFVLTDDLTGDLLRFMPTVGRLARAGASFSTYIVSDSLCCPSRASIFTGQLPHNTGVFTNIYPDGGFYAYTVNGNADRSFAVALRDQGYRTALMGKYLNGYKASSGEVPAGWTDWAGNAHAYQEYDYTLNVDGTPTYYGDEPEDYLTDVIAARSADFIDASAGQPFFLELSTFAPHFPAVPAQRHLGLLHRVRAPHSPAFNRSIVDPPRWLDTKRLSRNAVESIDSRYRDRARSVMSVDELVATVVQHLIDTGQLANTYFVFSSDNGYHMGEHRLRPGKQTAFDTDIRVPLIISGPGVRRGMEIDAVTQNTDLAPTFAELAGAPALPEADGRSLAGLLHGEPAPDDWRRAAIVEHRRASRLASDPDNQPRASGDPPSYKALRTPTETYVEYADGEREYYDDRRDPHQLRNAYRDRSRARRRRLHAQLRALVTCERAVRCATAPGARAARAAAPDRRSGRRR